MSKLKIIMSSIISVIILIVIISSFTVVDVGERGLVIGFGKIRNVLSEGIHIVNPLYRVDTYNIRNNKYEAVAESASSDLQKAQISVAVNYNIDETKIEEIYKTYGSRFMDRIFVQNVQEAIKSVSAKYTASELITKREQVKSDIKQKLQDMTVDIVFITDVAVTNVNFSDSFDSAIESKVKAEQEVLQAKATLEKSKLESEAIKIQAEAIKNSGGAEYVQLQAIQKWDGKLPTTVGGAIPFINIK
jgi:regulator of protease activity HflC (stomatin/prohibitin superfamily)